MSSFKKAYTQGYKSTPIEFQVNKDILFPKICIICGNHTEDQYRKEVKGAFMASRDYHEDYILNLPVCNNCHKNIEMKTGISSKSGILIVISSLIGLILAFILYTLTLSIFLSIALFTVALVIPFVKYKAKTKKKVKLTDFLLVRLGKNKDTLVFEFPNEYYMRYLDKINVQKENSEKIPAVPD